MAMTFGKGNRSIAFNPTSAFPLDARSYFESYEKARLAAASAQEASSTETQYYFGQDIVVVENGIASFYIIQPDGTLSEVGGKVEINEKVFTYVDGKLSLIGFADAVGGAQLVKTADGSIAWVKPDTTTVEGLSTAVEGLRTDLNTLTENVYTKGETDSKIAAAVAAAPHLKRKKIESLDDINLEADDVEQYIYMLPSGLTEDDNKYYEYYPAKVSLTTPSFYCYLLLLQNDIATSPVSVHLPFADWIHLVQIFLDQPLILHIFENTRMNHPLSVSDI